MAVLDLFSDRSEAAPLIPAIPPAAVTFFQKKVMVVMPWLKQISPITSFCVSQLLDKRRTAALVNYGDAFVAHTRNHCADVFLQTDFEYMLTIDDDMLVPFGDAKWFNAHTGFNFPEKFAGLNTLDRLMSHRKTLVGALYFGRHPHGPPVYNEGCNKHEAEFARKSPQDLIKPTKWVGTGCMLIHRSVFEAIEKRFPRLARGPGGKGGQWFTSTEASLVDRLEKLRDSLHDGPLTSDKAYKALEGIEGALASVRAENGLGCGEDVSFCMRATAAGHQPYVDMGLVCGHLGHCVYGPYNTRAK